MALLLLVGEIHAGRHVEALRPLRTGTRRQFGCRRQLQPCPAKAGDPYGNRTRVSAVKGPRPNR